MKTQGKINPILVILIAALLVSAITLLIVYLSGGRYNPSLPNGAKFLGKSENGQPVSGTIRYQDDTEAELDFYNRTIRYANGDVYIGEISNGCRHGHGIMSFASTGDVYEGYFQNDQITGTGTFKYSNGDLYVGGFLNSQKHGEGTFTYANGNSYVGSFENDVRSGKGVFKWASGASYEGDFANDLKHGYGTMLYESGDRYEGYFKNDMRDGEKGIYIWSNSERYNGTFRNNLMDTRTVDSEGNFVINEFGEYVHGEEAVYTFTTGRTYRGYFENGQAVGINITNSGD
ncbi:MAG: hypothetical protein IKK70_06785 [Clostridia bacterium]|nr:hypothetical protein [Clostridia bacterium]